MRGLSITLGAACLGCIAFCQATDGLRAITAEGARRIAVAQNPRPVPQVAVETMFGDQVMPFGQGPLLVEFIYTSCPTICQTSGGDFAELRDHLAEQGLAVPMYSISFDPENDDPEAMLTYAELHTATGEPWIVARPDMSGLKHLLSTFEVTVIPDEWGGYEHNIAVLLVNGQGEFAGAYDTRAFETIQNGIEALKAKS